MEKTFVMLKPDAVQRNLIGEVIGRFEKKGLKLVALKMLTIDQEMANQHYNEHVGKPFFDDLVSFITSGPVVAMVWEGRQAIQVARKMMGSTDPQEAPTGTIRGDYGLFTACSLFWIRFLKVQPGDLFSFTERIISYKNAEPWLWKKQNNSRRIHVL